MTINQTLPNLPLSRNGTPTNVQIRFDNLPPNLQNQVVRLTVLADLTGGQVQLQAENGEVLQARLEPPLPQGARLTVQTGNGQPVLQATGGQAALQASTLQAGAPQVTQVQLPPAALPPAAPLPATAAPQTAVVTGQLATITPLPTQQVALTLQPATPNAPAVTLPTNTPITGTVTALPANAQAPTAQVLTLNIPQQAPQTVLATLPQPLPQGTQVQLVQPAVGPAQIQAITLPQSTATAPVTLVPAPPTPAPLLVNSIRSVLPNATFPTFTGGTALTTTAPATPVVGGFQQPALLNVPNTIAPLPVQVTLSTQVPAQTQVQVTQPFGLTNPTFLSAQRITLPPPSIGGPVTLPPLTPLLPSIGEAVQALVSSNIPNKKAAALLLQNGTSLTVQTQTPLQTGQAVSLTLGEDGQVVITPLALSQGAPRADVSYQFARQWPLLQQALNVLSGSATPQTEQLAQASVPRLDALLPTLIQFVNAVQTGEVGRFLGDDTVLLLRALGIDLAPDVQNLQQLSQRPETTDGWRSFLFPYVEQQGDDPRQGGFFWRNQEGDNREGDKDTRFVVELELSQLGPLQLDGLMKGESLHLKLRLRDIPEEGFQQALREIVQNTLTAYGLSGSIAVERTQNFAVNPLAEIQHQLGEVNVDT